MSLEKRKITIKYGKNKTTELLIVDNKGFLFIDKKIKKLTDKIQDSDVKEVSESIEKQKTKQSIEINQKIFELLKKELGNFEMVL